jgi:streptogramin lyase
MAVDPGGYLVVGEQDLPDLWIIETTGRGARKLSLNVEPSGDILPGGLLVEPDGDIVIAERFGRDVVRLNRTSGTVEGILEGVGRFEEEFELQDIVRMPDGRSILISSKGYVVHVVDATGKTLHRFGLHGSRTDHFSFPVAAAIGPNGNLWIVDTFQHTLKVFALDGTFIGEILEMGSRPGQLFFPVDLAFGRDGRLYTLEKGVPRLQAFQLIEKGGGDDP